MKKINKSEIIRQHWWEATQQRERTPLEIKQFLATLDPPVEVSMNLVQAALKQGGPHSQKVVANRRAAHVIRALETEHKSTRPLDDYEQQLAEAKAKLSVDEKVINKSEAIRQLLHLPNGQIALLLADCGIEVTENLVSVVRHAATPRVSEPKSKPAKKPVVTAERIVATLREIGYGWNYDLTPLIEEWVASGYVAPELLQFGRKYFGEPAKPISEYSDDELTQEVLRRAGLSDQITHIAMKLYGTAASPLDLFVQSSSASPDRSAASIAGAPPTVTKRNLFLGQRDRAVSGPAAS